MKMIAILSTVALSTMGSAAFAQSNSQSQVRVQAGHFCAQNRCVRFSPDLGTASVQGRRPFSVSDLGLRNNPVISFEAYRQLYLRALRQRGVGGGRG